MMRHSLTFTHLSGHREAVVIDKLFTAEEISAMYRREKDPDERAKLFVILPYAQRIESLKLELMGWETYGQPGKGKS